MAIKFSGEFTTARSPEEVFDFLSDPGKFGPLLPDFQSMTQQDSTHFSVKVKVGVGNIRGSAEIKMELTEAVKPLRAQYKGQGNAVGSQVTVSAGFDLSPAAESTRVAWQGEAGVFGKLAAMAGGMLEPLGRKNIQKLIDGLQKALAEPGPLTAGEVATQVQGLGTPAPDTLQPGTKAQEPAVSPVEGPGVNLMGPAVPQSGSAALVEASVPVEVPGPSASSEQAFGAPNTAPEKAGAPASEERDHNGV